MDTGLHAPPLRGLRSYRPGISLLLGLTFAAVALLALAANFMIEQSSSIVRSPALGAAAARTDQTGNPIHAIRQTGDAMLAAIDAVNRAALQRANEREPSIQAEVQRASTALLDLARQDMAQLPGMRGTVELRTLQNALRRYLRSATALITAADERRMRAAEYAATLAAMRDHVDGALEGAFRIFGRVVTRQHLVQLDANLDILARSAAAIVNGSYTQELVAHSIAGEQAVAATLAAHSARLRRSYGESWIGDMQRDLAALTQLRSTLITLDQERLARRDDFLARPTQLHSLVARVVAKSVSTAETALAAVVIAPAAKEILTTVTEPSRASRSILAWISIGVLCVFVVICSITVRSIVKPVERLLHATGQLAAGDLAIRVPAGGIKELDTLAEGFNRMADQLAAAQEIAHTYQQQLEAKVMQRTQQLQHLAEHDPLTGLPNRRQLFGMLQAALQTAAESRQRVGVLFLDLDNFKNINDSLGHAFGDEVLKAIAERLAATVSSFGYAARLGGDEFTVVMPNAANNDAVRDAGDTLARAFQRPLDINGREIIVGVSVGVSVYPDHETTADALLSAADVALFRAKADGRGQMVMFTRALLDVASTRFSLEQGLRHAIERNEFELVFQPEIHSASLRPELVEALLRWRLPDGSYISPHEFMAIAEESGLIVEISDWVTRTAIEAVSRWRGGSWPEARVAINASPRQLLDTNFVDRLLARLEQSSLPPDAIEIELTETVLQTGASTIESLARLHAAGVPIALDDFGTGYSTLASLEQLPLSRIKLDRSLIASIDSSERSAAIATAIINLCHSLGLKVTAEGVERPEQLTILLRKPVMHLQGYLLARPARESDLLAVLKTIPAQMHAHLLSAGTHQRARISRLEDAPRRKPARQTITRL